MEKITKQTREQEKQVNRLLGKVLTLNLTKDEINRLSIQTELYAVGASDVLTCVAVLTSICRAHRVKLSKVIEILRGK